jgi:hypothetical protein
VGVGERECASVFVNGCVCEVESVYETHERERERERERDGMSVCVRLRKRGRKREIVSVWPKCIKAIQVNINKRHHWSWFSKLPGIFLLRGFRPTKNQ